MAAAALRGFPFHHPAARDAVARRLDALDVDGVVCLGGEDWWYHNRGHFDFQIMRRLARRWPVLFVNSLGVRMPKLNEKRVFVQRIARKLKSLSRGLVEAEPGFFVYSPFNVPGQKISEWSLGQQIRLAERRARIKRPLLWVHCPAGAALIGRRLIGFRGRGPTGPRRPSRQTAARAPAPPPG